MRMPHQNSLPDIASFYHEHGYVVVEHLLSPAELAALDERTRAIASGRVTEFPRSDIELEPGAVDIGVDTVRKLNRCAANDAVFFQHAGHARILDVVASLIGGDIKLYESQCFMKPPGGVEKPHHQDSAYFPIEPPDLVTCWTALDDVTLENGCLWVIPGSHRAGLLDHGREWRVGERLDRQIPEELIDRSRETPVTMPAGSCSFHHGRLIHRSGANRGERSRRGLAVHYMSAQSRWTDAARRPPEFPLLRGRSFEGCV